MKSLINRPSIQLASLFWSISSPVEIPLQSCAERRTQASEWFSIGKSVLIYMLYMTKIYKHWNYVNFATVTKL